MFLKLAREVELDVFELLLCHLQYISTLGKEYVAVVDVFCHILKLTTAELFELLRVVALYPTSLLERQRLPTTLCSVFVQQAVLDDLKLQLSDGADDLTTVVLMNEELCHTFAHQLLYSFIQLLALHRV